MRTIRIGQLTSNSLQPRGDFWDFIPSGFYPGTIKITPLPFIQGGIRSSSSYIYQKILFCRIEFILFTTVWIWTLKIDSVYAIHILKMCFSLSVMINWMKYSLFQFVFFWKKIEYLIFGLIFTWNSVLVK